MRLNRFLYKSYRFFYRIEVWRARRHTMSGITATIILVPVAVLGMDTHRSLIYQTFCLLSAIVLLAFLWSQLHRFRGRLKIIRKLPQYATVGQPFVYTICFDNCSAKPQVGLQFYEDVIDPRPSMHELLNSREPGEERRNIWDRKVLYYRWLWLVSRKRKIDDRLHAIPDLGGDGRAEVRIEAVPKSRGNLHLTGVTIARLDPIGLFRSLTSIPVSQKMVILPKRYSLPPILLPGHRKYHAGGVKMAASIGNFEDFISLRDYRPGDSMRHIHWKSSAKKNKLIIKEFQDEYFVRHALILDTFYNITHSDRFEEAVSIAASLVCSLQAQESLLDLIFVGDQAYRFSTGRGMASYETILELLASVDVCTHKPFDTIGAPVFDHLDLFSGCICVLLAWDEARKDFVERLKRRGVPLMVIVVLDDTPASDEQVESMEEGEADFFVVKVGRVQEGLSRL